MRDWIINEIVKRGGVYTSIREEEQNGHFKVTYLLI